MTSLNSIREQIAGLENMLPTARIDRVADLESQTLSQLLDYRARASRSTTRFDHYADAAAIQELEARLEFLRGLKFDLIKAVE